MRVARAFRLPIIAILTALALSGCMRTTGPVAVAQPQGDLDSMAYGRTYARAPVAVANSGGGAISALTLGLRRLAPPTPTRRCLRPRSMPRRLGPSAHDAAYQLDAGDKLRVVVYGQEGLTNTYAIDAGGSITMPLIGSVPARGRTPAGLARRSSAQAAQRLYPRSLGRGRDRILPAVLHPRRSRSARAISLRAQHDGRERGRDRRRLLAARQARPRHGHPHRRFRGGTRTWCRSAPRSVRATPCSSANAGSKSSRIPRCAIAHLRLWSFGPSRNDVAARHSRVTSSNASRRTRGCAARRSRRWPCRSSPARRNESRAARRDRCRLRPRAAWP